MSLCRKIFMRKQQNQAHNSSSGTSTILVLFNKPFEVLCQFTPEGGKRTLAEFIKMPNVYAAGRLDFDSEGLLVLTNNGKLQQAISHPRFKLAKTYWVQVEGDITDAALHALNTGVMLNDGPTLPAIAEKIPPPPIWDRTPPIRERKHIPTAWISLTIKEGRNRQVRRMTAATGFPTLRLIRAQIGPWSINGMKPGELKVLDEEQLHQVFAGLDWKIAPADTAPRQPTSKRPPQKNVRTANAHAQHDPHHEHRPKRPARPATPSSKKGPQSLKNP